MLENKVKNKLIKNKINVKKKTSSIIGQKKKPTNKI